MPVGAVMRNPSGAAMRNAQPVRRTSIQLPSQPEVVAGAAELTCNPAIAPCSHSSGFRAGQELTVKFQQVQTLRGCVAQPLIRLPSWPGVDCKVPASADVEEVRRANAAIDARTANSEEGDCRAEA